MSTPTSVKVAMTPARITEGSAPVSTTKNATVPSESRNRGQRASPTHAANASTGARTMATFSPLTTNRWPEPRGVEVTREPGIELGVVAEHQPQQQPGFLRREEPGDRGAHERAEHLRGADERVRCPTQPLVLAELEGDRDAFVVQQVREPGVVGHLERAFEQHPVAAHRSAGESLTPADPDRLPDAGQPTVPLHRADVDHGRPAEPAHRRIRAKDAGHRDPLRSERGQERPGEAGILDAGPSQRETEDAGHGEHPHRRARRSPFEARRRDGFERGRLRGREPETLQVGWAGPELWAPRAMPPPTRRCRPRTPSRCEPTAGEHSRRRGRPRTPPRPRAAPTCSHGDLVADLVQRGRADPTHVLEFVDRGERAVLGAVVDDGGRQHLTDPRERFELGGGRRVDVDEGAGGRSARRRTGRLPPRRRPLPSRPPPGYRR